MGILSFLGGSYKPKDFVGKTIDQIFKDMKLDKMDKSIKEHEEYAGLSEEIKSAIDLLLDLKDGKTIITQIDRGEGKNLPARSMVAIMGTLGLMQKQQQGMYNKLKDLVEKTQ